MFLFQECIYLPDLLGFPCRPQNPVAWQLERGCISKVFQVLAGQAALSLYPGSQ